MESPNKDVMFQLMLNVPENELNKYFDIFISNQESLDIFQEILNSNIFWYQKLQRMFPILPPIKNIEWKDVYLFLTSFNNYENALIWAASEGRRLEVQILIDNGIDPSIKNNAAIWLAIDNRRFDVFELLSKDPRVILRNKGNFGSYRSVATRRAIGNKMLEQALTYGPQFKLF